MGSVSAIRITRGALVLECEDGQVLTVGPGKEEVLVFWAAVSAVVNEWSRNRLAREIELRGFNAAVRAALPEGSSLRVERAKGGA